jgi:hypothetical protein|tara:strand:- start:290 stop:913 length:624 start_codon:yes stop_codon:yes gene_type:complete
MSLRLLPFRQYDENDVVNLFALDSAMILDSTTGDGKGSNGVFVKVKNGNFNQDVITYAEDSYLGKSDFPFVGKDAYPSNPLIVTGCTSGDVPLGLTLLQTAKNDENGEKLLYNATKREELQAVLPGQSVPVATKGIFTLAEEAFEGDAVDYTVGTGIRISDNTDGKITGAAPSADKAFGTVIGTGSRASQGGLTDQFAGEYIIVKIG